jgi:uncharacterized protein
MRVFADTWYFLALLNPNERGHDVALSWSRRTLDVTTTEYVLLELGNALSPLAWRPRFLALAESLKRSAFVSMVPTSDELLTKGMTMFGDRLDKTWSLTDCISFIVMRERGLADALTADRHFQQAGFRALLEPQ